MSEPMIGAVRVKRVDVGETMIVRMLSPEYGGLYTHWWQKRSHYCRGKDCNPVMHKPGSIWKGYCAAEVYEETRKKWQPICLEISEHLELDFRTIYRRGQLWEIFRALPTEKRQTPTQGKLLEERGEESCPPAFNYLPCLLHLYHVEYIDLSIPNPLPPRLILTESDGDAPKILEKKTGKPVYTAEEQEKLQRRLNERKPSPSAKQAAKAQPAG